MKKKIEHKMELSKKSFEAFENDGVTYELRLYDAKCQEVEVGDTIDFSCKENHKSMSVTVKDIIVMDSFRSLFEVVEPKKFGFDDNADVESIIKEMEALYPDRDPSDYYVVSFEFKKGSVYDFSMFMPSEKIDSDEEIFYEDVLDEDDEFDDSDGILSKLRNKYYKEDGFSHGGDNTLSPILYTLCFIACSLCIAVFFQTSVYTHILGLSDEISKVIFNTLFFGLSLIGYIKTFEDNRTITNSIFIPCLPVGIYSVITYFRFYPIVMGVIAAASVGVLIWLVIKHIIIPIKDHFFFMCDMEDMILSIYKYIGMIMSVVIILMAWIPSFGLPEVKSNVEKIPDSSFDVVYSITEKKEELAEYTGDNWTELNIEERVDFLQHIANAEKRYLGLNYSLEVKAIVLENGLSAQYDQKEKVIEINYDYLKKCKLEEAISSLAHECRHAYQWALIDLYESSSDEQKKLYVFAYVPEFIENFKNYKNNDNVSNYDEYYNQMVEVDARAYSEIATEDILEALNVN